MKEGSGDRLASGLGDLLAPGFPTVADIKLTTLQGSSKSVSPYGDV